MAPLAFDVFCRVIDNYGDAGVCWRLSRQLAAQGHEVRLWIDDRATLARLLPALDPQEDLQQVDAVTILPWERAAATLPPTQGVVIEAFACTLPTPYEAAMAGQHCLWINLEYLSAEPWVEGCHGLPSVQSNGVPKYFYFPGFTSATGGLLREPGLFERRDHARRSSRQERLQVLTGQPWPDLAAEDRCMLLFCYPTAPFKGLQHALESDSRRTWLLVPGPLPESLHDAGALTIRPIPFVPQAHFDELLWCCDLNLVRGEDSLVRSLWAATPCIWQIYPQEADAHLVKLEAWMDHAQWPESVRALQRAWNGHANLAMAQALRASLQNPVWAEWRERSRTEADTLALQADLAHQLVEFCVQHRQKS